MKENFLENLFIHQNFYIIAIIVNNCHLFINELLEDLINLKNYYSQIEKSNNDNIEKKGITNMRENINYVYDIVVKIKENSEFSGLFRFPQKIREFSAIVFNYDCIQHIKLPDEPVKHLTARLQIFENSDRLSCLIDKENGIILNDQVFHFKEDNLDKDNKINSFFQYSGIENILFYESKRKSCLNDILKCHDYEYIKSLKELCSNYNPNKKKENFPKTEKKEKSIKYKYSYENIYNTTGCVLEAIDLVMNKTVKNALVLIRPPGHHSGFSGKVENKELTSLGFCLVNNVAIGAAYAKNKYRDEIKKIAIFDFDIYYGNGTEEIIQMLNYKSFIKTFNFEGFYSIKTKYLKQINWLDFDDAKNILFISTHIYDEKNPNLFYPYSGGEENIYNIPWRHF